MAHARFFLLGSWALGSVMAGCADSHGTNETVDAGHESVVDGGGGFDDAPWFHDAYVVPADTGTMPGSCAPQDATEMACPGAICDGLDSYAWDGERCVRIDCGTCVGTDCNHLVLSQSACEANHASCIPEMCRATGGEWLFYADECQHYRCGQPQPAECLVGMPVCNCGDGRSFDPLRGGCFDDSTCPEVDPLPRETLCTSSGGTWTAGICCDSHCGHPCDLACAGPACVCGELQVFDPIRGCVDDAQCHVRATGEDCGPQVRCEDGLLCCQHCGGAGCDPTMTCTAPVCDNDPNIDTCGNLLFAP